MRYTNLLGVGLVVCLLLLVGGVSAQSDFSDEELEWIEIVSDAFDNMADVESYSVIVDQTLAQEITSGSGRSAVQVTNDLTQRIEMQVEQGEEGWNFNAVIEQDITASTGSVDSELHMTLEMIALDGEVYVHAAEVSPRSLASSFPEEWINLDDDGSRYPALSALSAVSPDALYNSTVALTVNEDVVLSIAEADSDEIDDQTMRVFEVEYDSQAMLESDAMAAIVDAVAGMMRGIDFEDLISQMAEGSALSFTVWIGEDDGLVHRLDSLLLIDAEVEFMSTSFEMVQTTESSAIYADFGRDFNVQEPDF
ncbi:MAG: hypothetical protein U0694_06645 [Anaerolineae bacterium]